MSVKSLGFKTQTTFEKKRKKEKRTSLKIKGKICTFSCTFSIIMLHVWPHEPTTFTFMCVTGTYVDVNPLWRDGWCNICLCGCKPFICVCVDPLVHVDSCSHISYVYVYVHSVCVYIYVCAREGGCQAEGDTMKWVAERAPPTIKALNGQPEVPVSVWMRRVLLGGEGQRVSDGTVWLRSDPATNVTVCVASRWLPNSKGLSSCFFILTGQG